MKVEGRRMKTRPRHRGRDFATFSREFLVFRFQREAGAETEWHGERGFEILEERQFEAEDF